MISSVTFWNLIARRYSRSAIADLPAYHRKLALTQACLDSTMDVLEIGCGTGSTALHHAAHVRTLQAIDFSPAMIAIAEEKRRAAGSDNVRFECTTIEALDPAAMQYDAVLALNVLHLVKDWRAVLCRIERLLKPRGVLVSSTACIGDSMAWFRYVAACGRTLGVLPELAVFTTPQLRDGIARCGLGIEHAWEPGRNKAVFLIARKPA